MRLRPVSAHSNFNFERHFELPGFFHLFFSLGCPVCLSELSMHFMHSTQHATVRLFLAQLIDMTGNCRIIATQHLGNTSINSLLSVVQLLSGNATLFRFVTYCKHWIICLFIGKCCLLHMAKMRKFLLLVYFN